MKKNSLTIRLQKTGKKSSPFFNIIVTFDFKSSKANSLAKVGYYNPISYKSIKNINELVIFKDLLNFWISKGAKPTKSVQRLLFY